MFCGEFQKHSYPPSEYFRRKVSAACKMRTSRLELTDPFGLDTVLWGLRLWPFMLPLTRGSSFLPSSMESEIRIQGLSKIQMYDMQRLSLSREGTCHSITGIICQWWICLCLSLTLFHSHMACVLWKLENVWAWPQSKNVASWRPITICPTTRLTMCSKKAGFCFALSFS